MTQQGKGIVTWLFVMWLFLGTLIVTVIFLQRYQNKTGQHMLRGNSRVGGYVFAGLATTFLVFLTIILVDALVTPTF